MKTEKDSMSESVQPNLMQHILQNFQHCLPEEADPGQRSGCGFDLVSTVIRREGQGQDNLDKNPLSGSPSFLSFFPHLFLFSSTEGKARGCKIKALSWTSCSYALLLGKAS